MANNPILGTQTDKDHFLELLKQCNGNKSAARRAFASEHNCKFDNKTLWNYEQSDPDFAEAIINICKDSNEEFEGSGWYYARGILLSNLKHHYETEPSARNEKKYVKDIELFARMTGKFKADAIEHDIVNRQVIEFEDTDKDVSEYEDV